MIDQNLPASSKEEIAHVLKVHKLMQVMVDREDRYRLEGKVQVIDTYLGGERAGGKVGRGDRTKRSVYLACLSTAFGSSRS